MTPSILYLLSYLFILSFPFFELIIIHLLCCVMGKRTLVPETGREEFIGYNMYPPLTFIYGYGSARCLDGLLTQDKPVPSVNPSCNGNTLFSCHSGGCRIKVMQCTCVWKWGWNPACLIYRLEPTLL